MRWTGDRYVVEGVSAADIDGADFVVKARDRFDEKTVALRTSPDGSFAAEFTPASMSGPDGTLPLKSGRWNFFLRTPDGHDIPFLVDRLAVDGFPVLGAAKDREYEFESRWYNFPQLHCPSDLSVLERGAYRQERLRKDVYEEIG
ncbi:CDP-glycerol:glycerophosphate glycerophosphotransferase, partial [Streptomyces violaceoruber]